MPRLTPYVRGAPSRKESAVSTRRLIECSCGALIQGEDDDDVVAQAQEHAKSIHDMELSREQALAMARPA